MTAAGRHAIIVEHQIVSAIINPPMYNASVLALVQQELEERHTWLQEDEDEDRDAELAIVGAFLTYLEALIAQRQRKEERA